MPDVTDWGKRGREGFLRDPNNEQIGPLPANGVFTGQWTRVDNAESFLLLYGTNVSFKLIIQWSRDGVTLDTDPFATTSPQVRNRLGLYSVISGQSTFFRPFYRMKIINGPLPQLFAVSDALILKTLFDGYYIDVDGPIPVLGLAHLDANLSWGRNPSGWQPIQLTALNNTKIALSENLLGDLPVDVQSMPPISIDNFPPFPAPANNPGSSFVHLPLAGTTVVKSGAGVLRKVVCNDPSLGITTLKLYNNTAGSGPVIANIRVPGATNLPVSFDYNLKFTTGLTAVKVGVNDMTVVFD